jgi:hypothetical protein
MSKKKEKENENERFQEYTRNKYCTEIRKSEGKSREHGMEAKIPLGKRQPKDRRKKQDNSQVSTFEKPYNLILKSKRRKTKKTIRKGIDKTKMTKGHQEEEQAKTYKL